MIIAVNNAANSRYFRVTPFSSKDPKFPKLGNGSPKASNHPPKNQKAKNSSKKKPSKKQIQWEVREIMDFIEDDLKQRVNEEKRKIIKRKIKENTLTEKLNNEQNCNENEILTGDQKYLLEVPTDPPRSSGQVTTSPCSPAD